MMMWQGTFIPKAKARKLKPELVALTYNTAGHLTKKEARLDLEKQLRRDGMSLSDYFTADRDRLVKVEVGEQVEVEEEKTAAPEMIQTETTEHTLLGNRESTPDAGDAACIEQTSDADSQSTDPNVSIASEIEWAISALEPGERYVRFDCPEEVYHTITGIGSSAMKEAFKSPAHYKAYIDSLKEWTPTQERRLNKGSAAHFRVLEYTTRSGEYLQRFAIEPEDCPRRNSNAYKDWVKAQGNKEIVSYSDSVDIEGIAKSISQCEKPNYLLTRGEPELSFWYMDRSGLILKARVDSWHSEGVNADLKTCRDASPAAFAKTVRYEYRVQDTLYRLVTGAGDMIFIGVDEKAPYACSMARVPESIRDITELEMRKVINKIAHGHKTGEWPGYDVDTIHEAEVWPSELKKLEEIEGEL